MTLTIELSDETSRRLEEQAAQRGLTPEFYAAQLIEAYFEKEDAQSDVLATYLLEKNQEFHSRLA